MKITTEHLEHIAKLARLKLPEEKKEKMAKEFESIVQLLNRLDELDLTGVEPALGLSYAQNIFREDIVGKMSDREELLQNAPSHENGYFKVPKVVE